MKYHRLKLRIIEYTSPYWKIKVYAGLRRTFMYYNPVTKSLSIPPNNKLSSFLQYRSNQLLRILNNKQAQSFHPDFRLQFVLNDRPIQKDHFDHHRIVAIDSRGRKRKIYKTDDTDSPDCEIFTDGSYNHSNGKGAFACMIRQKEKDTRILTYREHEKSNNLLELKALIKSLESLPKEKKLRITTDSQYVIKGISLWINNWKRNKWKTANNEDVKNKKEWKKLDKLIQKRYIELKWVESHSSSAENNLCDFAAKKETLKPE